jgi:hypothetical protein
MLHLIMTEERFNAIHYILAREAVPVLVACLAQVWMDSACPSPPSAQREVRDKYAIPYEFFKPETSKL